MACVDCDASVEVRRNQTVAYDFGGLPDVSLCGIEVRVCDNGHRECVLPKLDELHLALTHALVVKTTRLMPCEIKFMRKHLGWSQRAFARRMGVAPESASRWESGSVMMAPTAERLLRLMVLTLRPLAHYKFLDVFARLDHKRVPARMRAMFVNSSWRVTVR
ncbi:MAG TPA: type II TA system antitoxin MqsA family protein [Vicinamibacterales bacterium]|nr:type II TA system antitoxin MqsA family protein [Vicinamibacterales bacterium]